MLQGDDDWRKLAAAIVDDDVAPALRHNEATPAELRLGLDAPVPFLGPIMTAPVVLLLSHPAIDTRIAPADYAYRQEGWPLSVLHPQAPPGLAERWRDRLGALVDAFDARHVANTVAAVFLTPWPSVAFDSGLRLRSRARMLALAASAAQRDALVLVLRGGELWTEHADIAALPTSRRFYPKTWRTTRIDRDNLGDDAWSAIVRRVGIHAWL
jgi:hypothetical protein